MLLSWLLGDPPASSGLVSPPDPAPQACLWRHSVITALHSTASALLAPGVPGGESGGAGPEGGGGAGPGAGGEGRVARAALAGVADRLEAAVKAGPFAVRGAGVQRVPLVATIP